MQMEIIAPMGQGRWQLGLDEAGLWLRDARGLYLQGESVNRWLGEQTGFSIRLADWFAWLRNRLPLAAPAGLDLRISAAPDSPRCPTRIELQDERGRLVVLLKQWQGDCG